MSKPIIKIAARNVLLNWRHSLAALLSISAGFVALSLFRGYMADVKSMYEETFFRRGMLGHVLVERRGAQSLGLHDAWKGSLDKSHQDFLEDFLARHSEQVVARTRFLQVSGTVSNGRTQTIFAGYGYDVGQGARMRGDQWRWNTVAGKPLDQSSGDSILIGKSLGSVLDCRPKSKERFLTGTGGYAPVDRPFECQVPQLQMSVTTFAGQVNAMDAPVIGMVDAIFKEIDDKFVSMPLETAQRLMDTQAVSYYGIELKDPTLAAEFMNTLMHEAAVAGLDLEARRWQDHPFGEMYVKTMELLGIFRNFVVAVILAIAGLSVLNTLVKLVMERTRETGMMRSIGFNRSQITRMFTVEAIFLAALGNLIGLGLAICASWALNRAGILYKAGMLSEPVPFRIGYELGIYAQSSLFLFVIAVGAALLPARRSASLPIPEALCAG